MDVHDANSGATLARLTGHAVRTATSLATSPEVPSIQVPPAAVAFVWLDIPVPTDRIPAAITHRITIDPPEGVPLTRRGLDLHRGSGTGRSPACRRARPPARRRRLGSPRQLLRRTTPSRPVSDRREVVPRRSDTRSTSTSSTPRIGRARAIPHCRLASPHSASRSTPWPTGTGRRRRTTATRDLRVGEHREEPTPANAGGNRVVIDIGDGALRRVRPSAGRAAYPVRPGERVARGRQIANVGSSGTTGGPHLHFQVTDGPSVVLADGMPYVFDSFELTGQTPPLAEVLPYYDTLQPIPHQHRTHRGAPRRDAARP